MPRPPRVHVARHRQLHPLTPLSALPPRSRADLGRPRGRAESPAAAAAPSAWPRLPRMTSSVTMTSSLATWTTQADGAGGRRRSGRRRRTAQADRRVRGRRQLRRRGRVGPMDIPGLGAVPEGGAPLADGGGGDVGTNEQRPPTASPKELGLLIVRYAAGEAARGAVSRAAASSPGSCRRESCEPRAGNCKRTGTTALRRSWPRRWASPSAWSRPMSWAGWSTWRGTATPKVHAGRDALRGREASPLTRPLLELRHAPSMRSDAGRAGHAVWARAAQRAAARPQLGGEAGQRAGGAAELPAGPPREPPRRRAQRRALAQRCVWPARSPRGVRTAALIGDRAIPCVAGRAPGRLFASGGQQGGVKVVEVRGRSTGTDEAVKDKSVLRTYADMDSVRARVAAWRRWR